MLFEISHRNICTLAVKWLKRPRGNGGAGCHLAFSETAPAGAKEIPDALGFEHGRSVLVEVKVSRADFLADSCKIFRQKPEEGMGCFRYFMAPQGIIGLHELPKNWGLVEVTTRGSCKVHQGHVLFYGYQNQEPFRHNKNGAAEVAFLVRMLRRVQNAEEAHARIKTAEAKFGRALNIISKLEKENERLTKTLFELRYGKAD